MSSFSLLDNQSFGHAQFPLGGQVQIGVGLLCQSQGGVAIRFKIVRAPGTQLAIQHQVAADAGGLGPTAEVFGDQVACDPRQVRCAGDVFQQGVATDLLGIQVAYDPFRLKVAGHAGNAQVARLIGPQAASDVLEFDRLNSLDHRVSIDRAGYPQRGHVAGLQLAVHFGECRLLYVV